MNHYRPLMGRIQFIERRVRDGRYPNAASLAREYEVSTRTIQRDLDYMRDSLGCPLAYDGKRRGYYYTEPVFALPSVSISESELFALCVAEKALQQYRATPLYETLATVFDKLATGLPDEITAHYSWLNPEISFLQQSTTEIEPAVWETVSTALYTRTALRVSHRKAGVPEATQRTLEPYHMVSYEGNWYLIAKCRLRNEVLTFALSRISDARLLDEIIIRPENFNLEEYLGHHFGITREREVRKVSIEFTAEAAPYIRERRWHDGQSLEEKGGGRVVLSFKTNSLREVKRWVLGWGKTARVLEPKELVDEIIRDLESTIAAYR